MKPKAAWIDHCGGLNVLFAMEIRQGGIELAAAGSLDQFLSKHDLDSFPVLLYHPGVKEQHRVKEVMENYPNLTVAFITAPGSSGEYHEFDIPCYTYDVNSVDRFIRDNQ